MAFKMKGTPLHYGTSSYKSALKHNEAELKRAQSNRGADWKHNESDHEHKGKEIFDPAVTEKTKTGTKTTQNVRSLGADSTECEKGFHKNKDGKCIKDDPTGKSNFDFKKTCHDADGNRLRTDPRCKWADETEGKEVDKSTPDSKRVIKSETTEDKKKECVKPPKPEDNNRSVTRNWVWNEEDCKWKQEYEKEKKCRDADKKEKACIGNKRTWSAAACKCVSRRGGGGGKKGGGVGKVLNAVGGAIKKLFSKACSNCACDAYADAGSGTKMPEGHTSC